MATENETTKEKAKAKKSRGGLDYVFLKNCTNAHGHFKAGDRGRGAFSDQLVADYVRFGIMGAKQG